MFRNALTEPSRDREISTLSRPTWQVRKAPGLASSEARAAQNHMASNTRSCSWAKTSGAV